MHRPEDPGLAGKGVMHEGRVSARLGLAGVPATAEAAMIARDLLLVEEVGGRLHFHTVSAGRSLDLIRQTRAAGVEVTLDVGIHHLIGCDEDVEASGFSPMVKIQPPLRTAADREALRAAVADGTVHAVISHHVPLDADEKLDSFDRVPFGAIGLEHAVALALSELVRPGTVPLRRLVEVFATGPAAILGLGDRGTLRTGARADFTVLDLDQAWTIRPDEGRSCSRNHPYAGRSGVGRAVATYLDGVVVAGTGPG
jgi:dihydroorotase